MKNLIFLSILLFGGMALANQLPGNDITPQLETVGTIVRTGETLVFNWFSTFIAAIFIISSAVALKNMKFLAAGLCLVAGMIIVFTPSLINQIKSTENSSIFR
jgi:hypothetical protein